MQIANREKYLRYVTQVINYMDTMATFWAIKNQIRLCNSTDMYYDWH